VLALRAAADQGHGRTQPDFGAGVGVSSQLLARAGYETTRADVSTSLLDFAPHRLPRRVTASLHGALRPGGWLVASFDIRPAPPQNAPFPYDDDLDLRATLHRGGFTPSGRSVRT
jgi:SAM-dependent methyltransferase